MACTSGKFLEIPAGGLNDKRQETLTRSWEAKLESEYLSSERCSSLNDAGLSNFNPMMMQIISS